ncbi:hypothetical protein ES706_04872 [subsurface metagenome]
MTSFTGRVAKHILVINATKKAAKEFKKEIEKAGIDTLKILAEAGVSIVGTYLNGCSPQEKVTYRRDLNALLQMGVTLDMILTELARQMPELAPIMGGRDDYRKMELQNLERFLKEG